VPIVRGAVVVLALVVSAWFGLGALQAIDTSRATQVLISSGPLTAAQARRAHSLLSSAAVLNPDRSVDLLRGQLAFEQGHPLAAVRIMQDVTAAEPNNLEAWVALARVALHHDNAAIERAVVMIARLDPRGQR
jgi:predicted Zn-dependent protease